MVVNEVDHILAFARMLLTVDYFAAIIVQVASFATTAGEPVNNYAHPVASATTKPMRESVGATAARYLMTL